MGKLMEGILRHTIYLCLERQGQGVISMVFVIGNRFSQILMFFEAMTKRNDKGVATDVVYFDICKPFDKVSCGSLVYKIITHWICNAGDIECTP